MAKLTAAIVAGVLLGVVASSLFVWGGGDKNAPTQLVDRELVGDEISALKIFTAENEPLPASEVSFEQVVTLPSVFERATALHMLASQSNSSEVQNLIFESSEIVDEFERDQSLQILFSRLTELEPRTALQLARTEPFAGMKFVERSVWRTWAFSDFEEAIFEAKTQTSNARQKAAAQSLYTAFGYLGNDMTDRIEAELGIGPDRFVRSRFLYTLADQSTADAIDFINEVDDEAYRNQYASWLAHYASASDPHEAAAFAGRFVDEVAGGYYDRIVQRILVQDDPHAAIERLQATGKANNSNGEFRTAVSALVKIDMAAAIEFFEQSRSPNTRRTYASLIARQLAKEDPERALAWAREHNTDLHSIPMMAVLQEIARSDPQLALSEALKTESGNLRSGMVSSVLSQIARRNPQEAAALLSEVPSERHLREASQALAQVWMQSDPDAAISWIQSRDDELRTSLMQMAAMQIAHSDIDAAIRLLPRLDESLQPGVRQQIAQNLAVNGSAEEARNFIQQFDGQPGFERLQASVIAGIARTDAVAAQQMADQLSAGDARDQAYMQIVSQRAEINPADAIRMLDNIGNETMRGSASGQIAAQWAARDPAAAQRWASEMPVGPTRDSAILHMTYQWKEPSDAQQRLINSIENKETRGQAKVRLAYNMMHTDIDKARELLRDADIPEYQRQQVEMMFNQVKSRF